ncbi:MAG: hypothetical protein WA431_08070 [Candidatus Cybelea sp.]
MSIAVRSTLPLILAIVLTGGAPASGPIGFIDLSSLVARHPMHPVLVTYDRAIATLRGTLQAPQLTDTGARANRSATAIENETGAAGARVQNIAARSAADRNRERAAFATVLASQRAASQAMSRYADQLARATEANLAGYRRSLDESATRALAAREQQLHEKELTLAFDLARTNALKRLRLRLKVEDLHPDPTTRKQLEAELSALNAGESQAVAAMRHRNAAVLADYRLQVERDTARAASQMAAQLQAKAAANLALRRKALYGEAIPSQLVGSEAPDAGATAVAGELRGAGSNLSKRFNTLAQSTRQSQLQTTAEIRALEQKRYALRQSIVSQILRAAQALVQTRHLGGLVTSGPRPTASIDLTSAVQRELEGE